MFQNTDMHGYVSDEVLNILRCLKESGKVFLDYRISGNELGTTVSIRFAMADIAAQSTPLLPNIAVKSPATIRRDQSRKYSRQFQHTKVYSNEDTCSVNQYVPSGNTGLCGSGQGIPMKYACKQTMTDEDNGVTILEDTACAKDEELEERQDCCKDIPSYDIDNENNDPHDTECDESKEVSKDIDETLTETEESETTNTDIDEKDHIINQNKYYNFFLDTRTINKTIMGMTDDYIVQILCRTHVTRVLNNNDPDYVGLLEVTKRWKPTDISNFNSEHQSLQIVLANFSHTKLFNQWKMLSYYEGTNYNS